MIHALLFMIWFFSPAGWANMAPVLVKKIKAFDPLNKPIDGGREWRGHRLLGDHKTWRGLVAGWLFAFALVIFQLWTFNNFQAIYDFSDIDYNGLNPFVLSFLMAFGALGGDAVKSFFKRRRGVKPGQSWMPFDQLDWVLGAMIVTYPIAPLPVNYYVIGILTGLLLHPIFNVLGWLLRLKDNPL